MKIDLLHIMVSHLNMTHYYARGYFPKTKLMRKTLDAESHYNNCMDLKLFCTQPFLGQSDFNEYKVHDKDSFNPLW